MSYNLSLTPGTKEIEAKIEQLAQIITDSGADIVGLQEASDVNPKDVEELNQLLQCQDREQIQQQFRNCRAVQLIARLQEYPYAICSQIQSHQNRTNFGLIIVSRFPIIYTRPAQSLDATSQNGLLNCYLSCYISHPTHVFNFYNTQFSDKKSQNIIQNHQLSNTIKCDDGMNPGILAISLFNVSNEILEGVMDDSSQIQRFGNFNTFPSWARIQKQDRIYYRGLDSPANTEVIEIGGSHCQTPSTHCPIVTDFVLNL